MRFPLATTIERDGQDIDLRVIYDVTPYIPATGPTYSCGGQPAEGGEVELISVRQLNGLDFALTDAEEAALIAECEERAGDDMAEEAAAAEDWKFQEACDRQLMAKWEDE